ncbi:VCBS domain-containing protein, partial [Sphingomonas sp. GCM10030256]|uniref:VCBS domain-containing protein n=1 Tax=Sphingomonas sp. GCM10030256 TaxID=3273427 RepID=UPI00360FD819
MATNTSGGTTASFANTPQAKDDQYNAYENCVFTFDVMSNDLGGAAKILWSIDDATRTDDSANGTIDLLTSDIKATIPECSDLGARISIVDGKVHYDTNSLDWLAAGETKTDKFTYAIRLANGTLSWATVTVQVTGRNDGPVILTAGTDVAGGVTENAEPIEGGDLTDTGKISFADVDLSDQHSAAVLGVKDADGNAVSAPLGALTLGALDQTANSVSWTYTVADGALDFLAAGETRTQVYTVAISDGKGGTVNKDVTVVITGTNDAPTIVVAGTDAAGAVTEKAEPNEGGNLTDTGTISFADVDLTDQHSAAVLSVVKDGSGNAVASPLGTLTLAAVDQAANSVSWNFTVADGALDFLAAGETRTQVYTVEIGDGKGGKATQDVTVTITGTNDAASITGNAAGDVREDGDVLTTGGKLTVSDVDTGEALLVAQSDA